MSQQTPSVLLSVWFCMTDRNMVKKSDLLTAETPGPSSLLVWRIKTLQGRKVVLAKQQSKWSMWSYNDRNTDRNIRKAETTHLLLVESRYNL